MKRNIFILTTVFLVLVTFSQHVSAAVGTGGAAGASGSSGGVGGNSTGTDGAGGGGGGGSGAGGNGTTGAGGGLVLKNTSGTMTVSGSIDARGGGSSTTNGGSVKLFYTGSSPSTSGITAGRTYTAVATSQLSQICTPTIAVDDSSIGTKVWSSPSAGLEQDGTRATATATTATAVSHYLKMTGCNFSVPIGNSISGVRVDFYKYYADNGNGDTVTDNALRLVKGGTILSTDRASGSGWPLTSTWSNYGGTSDLWGTTLTPSDVNASNFGVALAANLPYSLGWGSSVPNLDATHITVYYSPTVNVAPSSPTLVAPSSGATGQLATPTFQLRSSDTDNDYLKYKILLYNSDCSTGLQTFDQTSSQTRWTGQDQQTSTAYTGSSTLSSSTIANFNGIVLNNNTTYCWKAAAIDPGGTNTFSSYSSTQTFTTGANVTPSTPTLVSPGSGATGVSTSPLLTLRSSDSDGNYLRYKILLYNSDCSTGLQTFDQTISQTGWTGQDQQTSTAYTGDVNLSSSTIATYGNAALTASTQYCWKAAAIDPGGTNTFSAFSATQLFTTGSATGNVDIRGNTQIRGGTLLR